ncbi:MAG: tripartite tricarboxylate transporter substrate binding protein [Ramlibacter sp.]|nr:tripartite tricarboxylate transporter substrate binding protein [Ramlibacter sp.]MDB5912884.1 tripartite tricarboxylate transporter substrate binding protein [Ramlibacter sp.]
MLNRRTVLASSLLLAGATRAQGNWPSRPLKVIVPLPPGGSPDFTARLLSERLQGPLGQALVVENKVGANGAIAREFVARQPNDGYTLLMTESAHVMTASFGKQAVDPIKDFEPVVMMARTPFVLAVNASLGVNTLPEFIALARSRPGQLNYGSSGNGAPHHFAAEMLRSAARIDVVHVPYKGSAAIIPALLSNEIAFTIGGINSLLPHFRSGKLKAIAVAGAQRTAVMPDLPTIAEAGPLPGFAMDVWVGLVGPAGMPRPVVERLNAEANKMLRDEDSRARLLAVGLEPVGGSPEAMGATMRTDLEKFARIAAAAHIKAD